MLPATRKTRLEALAYRINDWEDESGLASKQITSTPEKNSKGVRTPSKTLDQIKAKSTPTRFQAMSNVFAETEKKECSPLSRQTEDTQSSLLFQKSTPVKVIGTTGNDETSTPYKSLVLDKSVLQSLVCSFLFSLFLSCIININWKMKSIKFFSFRKLILTKLLFFFYLRNHKGSLRLNRGLA